MVIAMVNWVQVARVLYTETRSLAEREFIEAERSLGAGLGADPLAPHPAASGLDHRRLGDARHLDHRAARGDAQLPRHRRAAADPVAGATSSSRTRPISPPRRGWCSSPGVAIILLALAFNLVGDALRDILDPTQQGQRLVIGYVARRLGQAVLILLGITRRDLRPALHPPRRSGAADRRAQRDRRDGREHPRAARAQPAALRAIFPLSRRPAARRSRALVSAEDRRSPS